MTFGALFSLLAALTLLTICALVWVLILTLAADLFKQIRGKK